MKLISTQISKLGSAPVSGAAGRAPVAFTLIEILAAVTLMSIIVLGLLSMFNQTQRAFRGSMAQVDVLESGRLATDMLARELEQMTPSECPGTNGTHTITFFTFVPSPGASMLQGLPGTTLQRTNILQGFFYLTRVNQDWIGTGYQVLTNDANAGVGTLYRFSATNRSAPYVLSGAVANALSGPTANLSRRRAPAPVGICHQRLPAYLYQRVY